MIALLARGRSQSSRLAPVLVSLKGKSEVGSKRQITRCTHLGCPALKGLGYPRGTASGGGGRGGRGHLPLPRRLAAWEQVNPMSSERKARPTTGEPSSPSWTRAPGGDAPAPDKRQGQGSPAGATAQPEPSGTPGTSGKGETVAPDLPKLGGVGRAGKASRYLRGHKGQIHGVTVVAAAAAARARIVTAAAAAGPALAQLAKREPSS